MAKTFSFEEAITPVKGGSKTFSFEDALHPEQREGAFTGSLKASTERLKGEAALLAGKVGLMGEAEAEQYRKEKEAEAAALYTPTTQGWTEAPGTKIKELIGGSLPYMAVPVAAGAAALAAPEVAIAGLTGAELAAGTTSALQFTGSNLARQMDENKKSLSDTSLLKAGATAVPQAALDVVGLKMLPAVRGIFGQAGVDISEEAAKQIATKGLLSQAGKLATVSGKTMGAEGATEAGQQFLERLQAGLSITDPSAREEYFQSFVGGAVLGGALSVPGHITEQALAQPKIEAERQRQDELKRALSQQAAIEAQGLGQADITGKELIKQQEQLARDQQALEQEQIDKEGAARVKAEIERQAAMQAPVVPTPAAPVPEAPVVTPEPTPAPAPEAPAAVAPVTPEAAPVTPETPAAEQQVPPGFEKYTETKPDGTVVTGMRRIEEKPAEPLAQPKAKVESILTETGGNITNKVMVDTVNEGYEMLPLDDERTYKAAGKPVRTFTDNKGVTIALDPQTALAVQRNRPEKGVQVYSGDTADMTVRHIHVDKDKRKTGAATRAMEALIKRADKHGTTLYIEPAQLEKDGITKEQLKQFYSKFGFEPQWAEDGRVLVRKPGAKAAEKTQPEINRQRQQAKKAAKSDSLVAHLKRIGGINSDDKLDITGEKRMIGGGYNAVFKKGASSLMSRIEDGQLDDYLPYELRRQTHEALSDQPYDATEAYNYIADIIGRAEPKRPHSVEEDLARLDQEERDAAMQAEQEAAAKAEEEALAKANADLALAGAEERQAAAEQKVYEEAAPELSLTGQTNEEIAAAEKAKATAQAEEARKAAAPTAEDFTLTGSNRPADQAAARGAQDLFETFEARKPSVANPSTAAEIKSKFAQAFTGRGNQPVIVDTASELPQPYKNYTMRRKGVAAFVDPETGQDYYIADRIQKGNELGIIMHEKGVHLGLRGLIGQDRMNALVNKIYKWSTDEATTPEEKVAREIAIKAMKKADRSKEKIGSERHQEEVIAYFADTAVNEYGINPLEKQPKEHALVVKWLKDLWSRAETAIKKLGFDPKSFTPKDMVDLIYSAARIEGTEARPAHAGKIQASELKAAESDVMASELPPTNIAGEEVEPTWLTPSETRTERQSMIDDLLYKMQDNQRDTKLVQQAIIKAGRELADTADVYGKEKLYHGRTATKMRNFLLNDVNPIIKEMTRLRITPEEINTYLHNKHAEAYNNQMNELNPGNERLKDQGSGIHTDAARAYLANLEPGKKNDLEAVAKQFYKITKDTRKMLVESGDITQQTSDMWERIYPYYVPLRRVSENDTNVSGLGRGFSTRGDFTRRAMGSLKAADDIVGNILAEHERAIVLGEKMRVGQAVLELALKNPNPDFWMPVDPDAIKDPASTIAALRRMGMDDAEEIINNFMREPKERYIKKTTQNGQQVEMVDTRVNAMKRFRDNVFPVRVNGKDMYVFFNQNDPNANRMVKSLKNLDPDNLDIVLSTFQKFTQWFKNVNTQYNPVFGFVNLFRDTSGAMLNLSTTPLANDKAKVFAGITPAMRGIIRVLRDERAGKTDTTGPWAELYKDARENGFQSGHRESLIRRKEEMKIIEEKLTQNKSAGFKKAFGYVVGQLSDFNDMMENAVRLSAYKAALDKGMSKQKAAILAKDLTVNFDKRGQTTPTLNALYAFFNASVQGTSRIVETMKGPAGRKIVAGGIGVGVIQAMMMAMAGFKDDDPPEFIREKNFIIPTGDGKYITIPYPLGFNVLPNIGRITTDIVMTGGDKLGKRTADLFGSVLDAFNPLGSSGMSMQLIAPTILDIPAAIAENKDAFGRPIAREDRVTKPTPGLTRSRESASAGSKALAEFLNNISGGTPYQKGAISPTADTLDFIAGQLGGGVAREVMKVGEAARMTATGEEIPSYKVPLASRFFGETGSAAAASNEFYNNMARLSGYGEEIKGRRKNHEDVREFLAEHPEARLWKSSESAYNQVSNLNRQKKKLLERGADPERIKKIEERKVAIMRKFNARVEAAEQ